MGNELITSPNNANSARDISIHKIFQGEVQIMLEGNIFKAFNGIYL